MRPRIVAALFGLLPILTGCAEPNPYDFRGVSGVVRLDAQLADAAGTPTGTRTTATADGIRVWLLEGGREVGSDLTFRGAYAFVGLHPGHDYRTRIRVTPTLEVLSQEVTLTQSVIVGLDTLRLEHQGDFASRPNPFTSQVRLRFQMLAAAHVDLGVYDMTAARLRTLGSLDLPAGTHEVLWDGLDDAGHTVNNGTYWVVLTMPGETRADLVIKQP